MNWGKLWLPQDAKQTRLDNGGISTRDQMKRLGWNVEIVPDAGLESGIKTARMTFPRVYFDKNKAARLVECLKRYRRNITTTTNEPASPVHDQYSHGADAFRYMAIVADQLRNETQNLAPIKNNTTGIY